MITAEVLAELGAPPPSVVVGEILRRVRKGYAPPTDLTVSEFADQAIYLTSGPLAGTRWRTDYAPYQRGIMDAFGELGVEVVVVKGSSQWGKTSIAVNVVAFHMAHDPCPILVVEPTVEPMARDFAKNRLDPVIRSSPALADLFPKKRGRDGRSNTTLEKTYRGGSLNIAGANSAASLAARPVRLLVCDEVDRYPAELPGEGNTLAIAFKRTTSYRRRRRIMLLSSPTIVDAPIDDWHKRGDQRRYYVPCPACGCMHPYEWQQVRWTDEDPTTARIHCPGCDHGIDDVQRIAILGRGEWRPEQPDRLERAVVSFHLWEAYSPLSSLPEIVTGFLRARRAQKAGDGAEMHTWVNTTLGEAVELAEGEGAEPHVLLARRQPWAAPVPAGGVCLTLGVDTQDDRLEALVVAWGLGEQSWLVDRLRFDGDTGKPEPWAWLDKVLDREYEHETGHRLPIAATCIDTAGHRTTEAYTWVARHAGRRVFAIIGRDGQRPIVSSPSPRKFGRGKRPVALYTIGVDAAKALVVPRLNVAEPGPGFVNIPMQDWVDDELALQLTSEKLVKRFHKGVPEQLWVKSRARNEALDCFVYALAGLRLVRPDLKALGAQLVAKQSSASPAAPKAKAKAWINRRPGGWLKGGR